MRILNLALVLLLLPLPVAAQLSKGVHLDTVAAVEVHSQHTGSNACKPPAGSVEAVAERILSDAGISVNDETRSDAISTILQSNTATSDEKRIAYSARPHVFAIDVASVSLASRCALSYSFGLYRFEQLPNAKVVEARYYRQGSVWAGPQQKAAEALAEATRDSATALAIGILKARQEQ